MIPGPWLNGKNVGKDLPFHQHNKNRRRSDQYRCILQIRIYSGSKATGGGNSDAAWRGWLGNEVNDRLQR